MGSRAGPWDWDLCQESGSWQEGVAVLALGCRRSSTEQGQDPALPLQLGLLPVLGPQRMGMDKMHFWCVRNSLSVLFTALAVPQALGAPWGGL